MNLKFLPLHQAEMIERQSSPFKRSWFEFLLDQSLLRKHLANDQSEPSATELIVQFLINAQNIANNDVELAQRNSALSDEEKRNVSLFRREPKKAIALKLLALKATSSFHWNLNRIEKELSLSLQLTLLSELRSVVETCCSNEDPKCKADISFAHSLYHRWVIRTVVYIQFPVRGPKGLAVTIPGQTDVMSVSVETRDAIGRQLEEESERSADWLQCFLNERHTMRMPIIASFASIRLDENLAQHNWELGIPLEMDDVECQISFELGQYYFYRQRYSEAACVLQVATELYPKVNQRLMSYLDTKVLQGLLSACLGMCFDTRKESALHQTRPSLAQLIHQQRWKDVVGTIVADFNSGLKLSLWDLQRAVVSMPYDDENLPRVRILNAMRRCIEGISFDSRFDNASDIDSTTLKFYVKVIKDLIPLLNTIQKKRFKLFLCTICRNNVELAKCLDCSGVLRSLLTEAECNRIVSQAKERFRVYSTQKPNYGERLFFTKESNDALRMGQLEHALSTSTEPKHIITTMQQLQQISPKKQFSKLNNKWQLPLLVSSALKTVAEQKHDYVHVLFAKAYELRALQLYDGARELFEEAKGCGAMGGTWSRVKAVIEWEVGQTALIEWFEGGASEKREGAVAVARKALSAFLNDTPGKDFRPSEAMLELSCLTLINAEEWEFFAEAERKRTRAGILELCQVLAAVCSNVSKGRLLRTVANDLWQLLISMFLLQTNNNGSSLKRSAPGATPATPTVPSLARSTYHTFLAKLKRGYALTIVLSALARFYNILKDDCKTDVSLEYAELWPTLVTNVKLYCSSSCAEVLQATIEHALSQHPQHAPWMKIQADFCFAQTFYSAALRHYLGVLGVCTHGFTHPPPDGAVQQSLIDDTMLQRMSHCCTKLQCHTQAAVLLQFQQNTDYAAAFKALNERQCHDSCDSLYAFIWDGTLLEFLVNLHSRRGEVDAKKKVLGYIGLLELNSNNPEEIKREAANLRKGQFLRAMARQYL